MRPGSVGLGPADVRQDRHHRGAPLVGLPRLHQQFAAANYIYDDSTDARRAVLVSAAAVRVDGNLFGGNEPARTWFTAMKPIANNFGEVRLPPTDPRFVDGAPGSRVPSVSGMNQDLARQRLKEAGFQVADQATPVNSASSYGTVVGTSPSGQTVPGSIITIQISNGIPPPPPPPPAAPPPIPGLPPMVGHDGRRDPRPAADHRAGARPAATAAAATAVIGVVWVTPGG